MNRQQFITTANERWKEARDFWHNWRAETMDSYAFVSGKQWLEEDEALLNEQKRPPITFNYSEKMIDAVVGAEVSNRQEVRYSGRGVEDAPLAELWNAAADWARDECDADDEESDAFRDALICGLGWTWTRLSYDEDLDGKIVIDRIDPLEMWSDPAASKAGLRDRRWHFREYWVDKDEVKRTWPKQATFSIDDAEQSRGVIRHGSRYEEGDEDERDRHKNQVKIRIYECYEIEPVYRIAVEDGIKDLSEEEFKAAKDAILAAGMQFAKQRKRVYYRGFFAGDSLLEMGKSPCQDGFCFNPITYKRDRNKNTWYGLTRVMKDPQRWANKWLSQILHIINTNAKGGLLAEIGAFTDPKKAQDEWSSPDSVTLLNEGGLGKVEQKQQAPYPAGLDKLMEFALGSLPMVTGINLEALGLANRDQAGVLEQQRKQAAYGMLAPAFNALRLYRKCQGRVLLYYIHEYISDGRLIRIGGPESQQFLPLTKQQDAPRYDIIVDQSPNAPDTKQKTWETLVEIIPAMLKAGIPLPPDLLDFTPLPTSLTTKWKEHIANQQQVDEETQQQMQQLQKENESLKQDREVKMQELEFEERRAQVQIQLERMKLESQIELERIKAEADFHLEQMKMNHQMALEQHRAANDTRIQQQKADQDFEIKQQQIEQQKKVQQQKESA